MKRVGALIILASVVFSAVGCVVRTRPEHAHYYHHHPEHREVVVVHHY